MVQQQRWGRIGAGLPASGTPAAVWRDTVARVEAQGYGSLWMNEGIGRGEAFSQLALTLAASENLVACTGIANIWARQAPTMQAGAETLAAAFPGRLTLGLGVSARVLVEMHGMTYGKPIEQMTAYLDRMDAAAGQAFDAPFPRLLAALGPKMLELAADRADGAYPHSMPVEHTARARSVLGPDKLLVVGVGVFLDADRSRARAGARQGSLFRIPGSPYVANMRRLGFPEAELGADPSDRVIDAMFACGDEKIVAARVREHLDAGADHVVVQPMGAGLATLADHLELVARELT